SLLFLRNIRKLQISSLLRKMSKPKMSMKLVVIGDGSVGKTTLLHRYINREFIDTTTMTIGVDFYVKEIEIEDTICQLNLWDISGQDRFFFMVDKYMRGASGALLLYDITSMTSFVNLDKWVKILREKNTSNSEIPIILIASKYDLEEYSIVGDLYAKKKQTNLGLIDYIKTSSKTGKNVDLAFKSIAKYILEQKKSD
ncbi:MAG: GTP-binding protein, partial [Candidatus Lokiarchaeota archaeon]|nr:GTP-binding protein [Candidatus Lokiarchaeota archaeon]